MIVEATEDKSVSLTNKRSSVDRTPRFKRARMISLSRLKGCKNSGQESSKEEEEGTFPSAAA